MMNGYRASYVFCLDQWLNIVYPKLWFFKWHDFEMLSETVFQYIESKCTLSYGTGS